VKRLSPLWMKIRRLRRSIEDGERESAARAKQAKSKEQREEIKFEWHSKAILLYEDLDFLLTSKLLRSASRLRIAPPRREPLSRGNMVGRNWELTNTFGYEVLTPEGSERLSKMIWVRRLEVLAIIFGISSVVQTFYTVLAYYSPHK